MAQHKYFRVISKINNEEGRFRFNIRNDLNSVKNLVSKIALKLGGFEIVENKEEEDENSNIENDGSIADEEEEEINNGQNDNGQNDDGILNGLFDQDVSILNEVIIFIKVLEPIHIKAPDPNPIGYDDLVVSVFQGIFKFQYIS